MTEESFFDFLPPQGKGPRNGIHDAYADLIFSRLGIPDIQEDITKENIDTTGQALHFYSPKRSLPSDPLGADYYRLIGQKVPEPLNLQL